MREGGPRAANSNAVNICPVADVSGQVAPNDYVFENWIIRTARPA